MAHILFYFTFYFSLVSWCINYGYVLHPSPYWRVHIKDTNDILIYCNETDKEVLD